MSNDKNKDTKKQEMKEKHKKKIEEKKREAGLVRKIVLACFVLILIAITVVGIGSYRYVMGALGPVDEENDEPVEIDIPIGSTSTGIGEILEENGVVTSATMFRYYVRFQNESGFQAGNYQISPSMSMDEIIDKLKDGRIYQDFATSFTIPEGRWLEDSLERIANETNVEFDELIELVRDEEYLRTLIERYAMLDEVILNEDIREPLEGYMFPARYDFVEEELTATQIIEASLDRTAAVLERNQGTATDDTIHEVLIKASIIEGEARNDQERITISGVIRNRIQANMPLQMDPTVAYAHGEHLARTLNEHLDIQSPYNTYWIRGLPVGPINNPGEASIIAALAPEEHDYLYFYHAPGGDAFFTETLPEHNAVVEKYRN